MGLQKNKAALTEISRNSHNRAWWLCRYGHSWNAKICERTQEGKTCTVCESEFDSLLLQLLVSLYAKQYNIKVVTFDDSEDYNDDVEDVLNDAGLDLFDLELMDDDERAEVIEDAGLAPDDFEF